MNVSVAHLLLDCADTNPNWNGLFLTETLHEWTVASKQYEIQQASLSQQRPKLALRLLFVSFVGVWVRYYTNIVVHSMIIMYVQADDGILDPYLWLKYYFQGFRDVCLSNPLVGLLELKILQI